MISRRQNGSGNGKEAAARTSAYTVVMGSHLAGTNPKGGANHPHAPEGTNDESAQA